MNFIIIVLAVIFGLYLFENGKGLVKNLKKQRELKQLLKWKDECEKNIASGKKTEENKSYLQTVNKMLSEFSAK